MSPFLLIPLSLIGAAMMLFGVGEWGRWWYLLVFLSIPLSLSLLFLIPTAANNIGVILVPALAALALTPSCVGAMRTGKTGTRSNRCHPTPDKSHNRTFDFSPLRSACPGSNEGRKKRRFQFL
jgi:hypothetical protein